MWGQAEGDGAITSAAASPQRPTAGDVITVAGARYELLGEPFLGMTGSSVFDSHRLFWRARARGVDGDVGYVTWPAHENAAATRPEA